MSNRNRIIYQSEALFVGPSPSTGNHFSSGNSGTNLVNQIHRVQSIGHGFTINRQPINQFGELADIDRVILKSPTVPVNFSYLLANFWNESKLGFTINPAVSAISGILNQTSDEKNLFIEVVDEGVDVLGTAPSANNKVIGIGNSFLTSYSVSASVGALPMVNVGFEALNAAWSNGTTGNYIPAINPVDGSKYSSILYSLPTAVSNPGTGDLALSALRPGDITINIFQHGTITNYAAPGADISNSAIQSFTLSFDLKRTPLEKFGSKWAFTRFIDLPVEIKVDFEALAGNLTTGSLADLICLDTAYDIQINLNKSDCDTHGGPVCVYYIYNAKLDGQSFKSDLGRNEMVNISLMAQVGGPNQTNNGLYMSGIYQ